VSTNYDDQAVHAWQLKRDNASISHFLNLPALIRNVELFPAVRHRKRSRPIQSSYSGPRARLSRSVGL